MNNNVTVPLETKVGDLLSVEHKPGVETFYRVIGSNNGEPIMELVSRHDAQLELLDHEQRRRLGILCFHACRGAI